MKRPTLPTGRQGHVGVLHVELGRRDVHHDGRACRYRSFLHRGLAVVGVTLLEGCNNVASRRRDLEDRWRFRDCVLDIDRIDHGDVIPMAAPKRSGPISPRRGVPGVVERSLWLMRIWSRSISPDLRIFLTAHVLVLFYGFRPRGQLMLFAVVGTSFILSIGVLMAYAVDAFRNRLPQKSL